MFITSEEQFDQLVDQALRDLPGIHAQQIENIAFLRADEPSPEQRSQLKLRDDQTLFGLYEGVPLSARQGRQTLLPDKITLFKGPLERSVNTLPELKEQIRHTLWHEIGHYFGLDHKRIAELDR